MTRDELIYLARGTRDIMDELTRGLATDHPDVLRRLPYRSYSALVEAGSTLAAVAVAAGLEPALGDLPDEDGGEPRWSIRRDGLEVAQATSWSDAVWTSGFLSAENPSWGRLDVYDPKGEPCTNR